MFCIGEAPGRDEDLGGRPFIGQAGREFNENYLNLVGLHRDEVYVTNTRKCRPDLNRKPTYTEAMTCASHFLPSELAEVQPDVVVLMGATACSLISDIDLDADHGIPTRRRLYNWEGWVVPMWHPALGLHSTSMMTPMLEDWDGLRQWLENGEWNWPEDSIPKRDYRLCRTVNEIDQYFLRYGAGLSNVVGFTPLCGVDSESHDRSPWSIQVSINTGTGLMVRVDDGRLIHALGRWIEPYEWVFHNAQADMWVSEVMQLSGHSYRDTMQESYHFGRYSKLGLKPLSRRLLGRSRKSWEETVVPYSKDALSSWMCQCLVHAEENWRIVTDRFHKKTGRLLKPHVQASKAEKMLQELHGYMTTNPEYKIWDKLVERMPEEWLDMLVDSCGPVPQKGIAHTPISEAVYYGCSDADDTLALAIKFDSMREEFIHDLNIQDEDIDAPQARICG